MSRTIDSPPPPEVQVAPLTPARWADLETVFGDGRGVCGQCWCMYWRMPRRDFEASLGAGTRQLFRARVEAGPPPGLLAYRGGAPVGWVQVGPRADVPGWNGARRLTAPTADGASRRPAGVGHLLLRDQGGLPPARDRDGAPQRRGRLGPPQRRAGARCLPGRRQRHPTADLALPRARVDVSPRRLSRSRATSPRSAADAPRAQRLKSEARSAAWSSVGDERAEAQEADDGAIIGAQLRLSGRSRCAPRWRS